MALDQNRAPILEAMRGYHEAGAINFTPPGHRNGDGVDEFTLEILGAGAFRNDIDMLNGLDDREQRAGILSEAQELLADALGVRQSFFSTSGSTLSVQTAFLSLADQGDKVIVARNSHKSVIESVVLSGVQPVFADPVWDPDWEFTHPPAAETIRSLLDEHPDVRAVFLVSPTDYGTVGQLEQIAEHCHGRGVPLIVDEAWAAHLPWHDSMPISGIKAGADLVIHSIHKTGAGLLQASALHINGDLVDPVEIGQRMDLLASTSASAPIYASIDGWRRHMALHGKAVMEDSLALLHPLRQRLSEIPGIRLFDEAGLAGKPVGGLDPYKVTIDVGDLGMTGFEFVERLRNDHHVNVLLGNRRRISAILAPGDTPERLDRLEQAIKAVAADPRHDPDRHLAMPSFDSFLTKPEMLPRDAFFGRTEQVPAEQAVGRICAEMVSPYPPGIPVLIPGMRITQELVNYLREGAAAGYVLPDPIDSTLDTVRVVQDT